MNTNSIPMKTRSYTAYLLVLVVVGMLFIASRPPQDTFDKITVREFELVDKDGTPRVTIQSYPDGEVVFRLRDDKGLVRVKLGAGEGGSGFVLLNDEDGGIQAVAKNKGVSISEFDKDGKKRVY